MHEYWFSSVGKQGEGIGTFGTRRKLRAEMTHFLCVFSINSPRCGFKKAVVAIFREGKGNSGGDVIWEHLENSYNKEA